MNIKVWGLMSSVVCSVVLGVMSSLVIIDTGYGQINKILGASADGTIPPVVGIPCTTFGFTPNGILTLPAGGTTHSFVSNGSSTGIGAVLQTRSGTTTRLIYVNLQTLAVISDTDITSDISVANAPFVITIMSDEGDVYVISQTSFGTLGCTLSSCFTVSKYVGTTQTYKVVNNTFSTFISIPFSAAEAHNGTIYVMVSCAGGTFNCSATDSTFRQFFPFSKSTGVPIGYARGPSASLIPNPNGLFVSGGFIYTTGNHSGTVIPSLFELPVGGVGPSTQRPLSGIVATANPLMMQMYAVTGDDSVVRIAAECGNCDASFNRIRGYIDGTSPFVYGASVINPQVEKNGGIYDTVNNRVYSYRSPGDTFIRVTRGPTSTTVEQVWNCNAAFGASCQTSANVRTGALFWNQTLGRIFVGNNANQILRINPCSSGGPVL